MRQFNYGALIDIVKKAEYSLDFVDHDNWDGGIDYFKLRFHLKYADFAKILSAQKNYEEILTKSLNSFYKDERFVITGIELVAKIDQYVDWAAVAPQHNKESVLRLIEEEKGTLIKAGTGIIQIRDKKENDSYKQRHQQLLSLLKQLGLEPVHRYNDLWDWYNDYKQRGLDTYQSRRAFIRDIYAPLIDTLENSEENTTTLLYYEPTGWDLVDDGANRMKEVLISAEKTLDYQSVGMYGRELLITLHRQFLIKQNTPLLMGQILEQRIQNVCWMLTSITVCIRKAKSVKLNLRKPQLISQTNSRTIGPQQLWMLSYVIMRFYLLFISSAPCTNTMVKKRAT